jgi:hypothetical protein
MSHTPAPWTVSELDAGGEVSEYYILIEPNVAVIERKVAGKDQHDMADARLIASAPDLLEACQWCIALCEEIGATETNAYASARAAIAKATGETA